MDALRYEDIVPGTRSARHRLDVSTPRVNEYVLATDDSHPAYLATEGGTVPPMLLMTFAGLKGMFQRPLPDGVLHGRDDLEWRRPARPGEALWTFHEVTAKEVRRGRPRLVVTQTVLDADERVVARAAAALVWPTPPEPRSPRPSAEPRVERTAGRALPTLVRDVTQTKTEVFARLTDGGGRIHLDAAFARSLGLADSVVHGRALVAGAIRSANPVLSLEDILNGGRLEAVFLRPITHGQQVTFRGELAEDAAARDASPRAVVVRVDAEDGTTGVVCRITATRTGIGASGRASEATEDAR